MGLARQKQSARVPDAKIPRRDNQRRILRGGPVHGGWRGSVAHYPLAVWQTAAGGIAARVVGGALVVVGLGSLASAFAEFVKAGGNPGSDCAPVRLVVSGLNRYVRNPMYVGLVTAILGQALMFGNSRLVLYAAAVCAGPAAWVRWYEEPTLARLFSAGYERYRRAVPAWLPRLRPCTPHATAGPHRLNRPLHMWAPDV